MAQKTATARSNGLGYKYKKSSSNEQKEIENLAYQFFAERGYEHGHDQEDWLRAEAIIKSRRS